MNISSLSAHHGLHAQQQLTPLAKDFHRTGLQAAQLVTPLGTLLAIADQHNLQLLEFTNHDLFIARLNQMAEKNIAPISPGAPFPTQVIAKELQDYCSGNLQHFKTPFQLHGTPFQLAVWKAISAIRYGKTSCYRKLAEAIKRPQAYRAVANAVSANPLAIIVPCHRVIHDNGDPNGYRGGNYRKLWLLQLEKEARWIE